MYFTKPTFMCLNNITQRVMFEIDIFASYIIKCKIVILNFLGFISQQNIWMLLFYIITKTADSYLTKILQVIM